jgi:hypothetical protein
MAMLSEGNIGYFTPQCSKRLRDSMPPMMSCSPALGFGLPRVSVTQIKQGHGFTEKAVYDANIRLKAENKQLQAEVAALMQTLFKFNAVSEAAQGGLVLLGPKKSGPKIANAKKIREARMLAESAVLELSMLVQGREDLVQNALDLLQATATREPAILPRLATEGLLTERLETVVDNRYTKHDKKRLRVAPVISTKNSFLWQAGSIASNGVVNELRRLGGKALV